MSKENLIKHHNRVLEDLRRKYKGCTAEDMKAIFLRDIGELEAKIKRVEAL